MKTIRDWRDLNEFGIDLLTGEACAIGARYLCDVSEKGRKVICEFFGLPYNTVLQENYNSGRGNPTGPSVGAVMLPYSVFAQLSAFCLLSDGADEVLHTEEGHIMGFYPEGHASHDYEERYHEMIAERGNRPVSEGLTDLLKPVRWYRPLNHPRRGLSCIHAMSGRSA